MDLLKQKLDVIENKEQEFQKILEFKAKCEREKYVEQNRG